MGNPAIYYNGKTIQFPYKAYDVQLEYPHTRIANRSASKVPEILNVSPDVLYQVKARLFENATYSDLKRHMYQWWEWAIQGFPWQYALDSSRIVQTNLAINSVAGTNTAVVVSAAGVDIGSQYVIRNKFYSEVIKVTGISVIGIGETALTLADTLNFSFAGGARVRDEMYWPALLYTSEQQVMQNAVREKPPLHFDIELMFTEDMTIL